MRVVLFASTYSKMDEGHTVIANGLRRMGHEVTIGLVNTLSWRLDRITCRGVEVQSDLEWNGTAQGEMQTVDTSNFDLGWVLNQPAPGVAREVWQMLWLLNRSLQFVNDVDSLILLNNKITLPAVLPASALIESYVSNDFDEVWSIYSASNDDSWIVKPVNDGAGANVFLLEAGSRNNRSLIQSMTGNQKAAAQIDRSGSRGLVAQYCVLQKFLQTGQEKRVIMAGGHPIVQAQKHLPPDDHRGNAAQFARPRLCDLSPQEDELCRYVGNRLLEFGIRYCGFDLFWPKVFEVNLVNPGGLSGVIELGGPDRTEDAVQLILNAIEHDD